MTIRSVIVAHNSVGETRVCWSQKLSHSYIGKLEAWWSRNWLQKVIP